MQKANQQLCFFGDVIKSLPLDVLLLIQALSFARVEMLSSELFLK